MRKELANLETAFALAVLAALWHEKVGWTTTYQFIFNNTEQGPGSTASPTVQVGVPGDQPAVTASPGPLGQVTAAEAATPATAAASPTPESAKAAPAAPTESTTATADLPADVEDGLNATLDSHWKISLGASGQGITEQRPYWSYDVGLYSATRRDVHSNSTGIGANLEFQPWRWAGIALNLARLQGNSSDSITEGRAYWRAGFDLIASPVQWVRPFGIFKIALVPSATFGWSRSFSWTDQPNSQVGARLAIILPDHWSMQVGYKTTFARGSKIRDLLGRGNDIEYQDWQASVSRHF